MGIRWIKAFLEWWSLSHFVYYVVIPTVAAVVSGEAARQILGANEVGIAIVALLVGGITFYSMTVALGIAPTSAKPPAPIPPTPVTPTPLIPPPSPPQQPARRELTGEQIAAKIRNTVPRTHGDWRRIRAHTDPGSEPPTPQQWLIAAGNYASDRARTPPPFGSVDLPTGAYRDWEEKIRIRLAGIAPNLALEFAVASAEYQTSQGRIDFTGLERHSQILAHDWAYAKGRWENAAKILLSFAPKVDDY